MVPVCFVFVGIATGIFLLTRGTVHSAAAEHISGLSNTRVQTLPQKSTDGAWTFQETAKSASQPSAGLRSSRRLKLDRLTLTEVLKTAPMEFTDEARQRSAILMLPIADGRFERFAITQSPVMAPELGARYPDIKTYSGQGIDDPSATSRFDWTPSGLHGITL